MVSRTTSTTTNSLSNLVVAAGTYDGVLAGWEYKPSEGREKGLQLVFATAVHAGSIRSLSIATSPRGDDEPGSLLSCGYDETLKTHDWHKKLTSSGEVRTPTDFGTPVCSSFAPPMDHSTHCILGFTSGKICIYKKRDWSIQHVLAGHDGGVGSLAVHPSGKLALSGGVSDGKLKLWDLTKGRLAFVNKFPSTETRGGRKVNASVDSLAWSRDGNFYAFSYGSHVTVRQVATGKDLLDVELPSKVNQVTLMSGPEGIFVVAACNDGSLPVLAVEDSDDENRRAIMAIEPVESHLAREERFKCIHSVGGYNVVTANSAGVVSLMKLDGAVKMISSDDDDRNDNDDDNEKESDDEDDDDDDDDNSSTNDDENGEDMELAVEIIDSKQLGTGARITCLSAWFNANYQPEPPTNEGGPEISTKDERQTSKETKSTIDTDSSPQSKIQKRKQNNRDVTMDEATVKKARLLVEKAKRMKKRKDKKKGVKSK